MSLILGAGSTARERELLFVLYCRLLSILLPETFNLLFPVIFTPDSAFLYVSLEELDPFFIFNNDYNNSSHRKK